MQFVEYGKQNKEIIVLLHGGGMSWWNFRDAAELLSEKYRVILPCLDGHAKSDKRFTSIESNASEIVRFIDDSFGGSVLMIGGVSLGAQIALEILSQRASICAYALIESALAAPMKLTALATSPSISCSYFLIKKKWFAKLQARYLGVKDDIFEEYYRDTCAISKADMIAFMRANSLYSIKPSLRDSKAKAQMIVGENEIAPMLRSAKLIASTLSGSTLEVLPKMKHGELSLNHAQLYVDKINKLINKGTDERHNYKN